MLTDKGGVLTVDTEVLFQVPVCLYFYAGDRGSQIDGHPIRLLERKGV
jgi:hypothetical protein